MVETQQEHLKAFGSLSRAAQQRLRVRIAEANGNIDLVAHEIRLQIEQLDRGMAGRSEQVRRRRLADRAHFVAQLAYLDLLEAAQAAEEPLSEEGFLTRLRAVFRYVKRAE